MLFIFYVCLCVLRPVRDDDFVNCGVVVFALSKTDVGLFVVSSNAKLIPKVKLPIPSCFSCVLPLAVCLALSGVIERWELLQAQSRGEQKNVGSSEPQQLTSDLDDITSWLEIVTPALDNHQRVEPVVSVEGMMAKAKELRVS